MATCLQTTANYSLTSSEMVKSATPTGTFAFEVKAEPFPVCYLHAFTLKANFPHFWFVSHFLAQK